LLLAIPACLAATGVVAASTPRDGLLRLVPADVGFCLVIRDLRGHGTALTHSPFVKAFPGTGVGSKVAHSEEVRKLSTVEQLLQSCFEVNAEQLRDEILGDELVLAYRPGPPGKPEQEQGLLLLRARNPQLLARLVERLNQLAKDSGSLKRVEEEAYQGRKYYRRVEAPRSNYYSLEGPVLAVASGESLLRELIDRDIKTSAQDESPVARQFQLLGVDNPLASLWLNPRAFEPALRQKAAAARGPQAAALKALLAYWTTLEGAAVAVALERDLKLSVAVRARPEQLPPAGRRLFAGPAAASDLWATLPPEAILMTAGRLDVPALVDFLAEFLDAAARQSLREAVDRSAGAILGKDFLPPLLAALGPEWGVRVAVPPAGEKPWFPHAVAVLRVRPNKSGPPADLALRNSLSYLAGLAVFSQNGGRPGPLSLKFVVQDGMEVKYLVNEERFPPGLQPAFAVKDGYLVLATSPEAIRRLQLRSPAVANSTAAAVPLLRFSSREFQKYLTQRRAALVEYCARKNDISREKVGRRLDGLLAVLQLLDDVELTWRPDCGRVTFTLRIQTAQPLK
jgi:hypothetical protein